MNSCFQGDGIDVQEMIPKSVYLVRGFPKGGKVPDDYDGLTVIHIKDGELRFEGMVSRSRIRIEQQRSLRRFIETYLGFYEYTYFRSDGKSLTVRTSVLPK